MLPEDPENKYAWMYRRLFLHASIWRRRPEDWRAVAPYLAMSYLYKPSNRFWHMLIKYYLVHAVWRPLVELTRLRHPEGIRPKRGGLSVPSRCNDGWRLVASSGINIVRPDSQNRGPAPWVMIHQLAPMSRV